MSGQPGAHIDLSAECDAAPPRAAEVSSDMLGVGMQLVRASNLTMSRFQLALQRGDRRLATKAMDNILDIDAEMECFVAELARSAANDPHMEGMASYLTSQKDAVAREKHALVGGIGKVEQAPQAGVDPEDRAPLELDVRMASPVQAAAMEWIARWPVVLLATIAFCAGVVLALLMLVGAPSA